MPDRRPAGPASIAQAGGASVRQAGLGNRLVAAAALACGLLGLAAAGLQAMPADAQRPDNWKSARLGRVTAERYCQRCHAVGRDDASRHRGAPPFREIAERYSGANPEAVLADGIVLRHPGMPEFRLSEAETDGLVAYIRRTARYRRR